MPASCWAVLTHRFTSDPGILCEDGLLRTHSPSHKPTSFRKVLPASLMFQDLHDDGLGPLGICNPPHEPTQTPLTHSLKCLFHVTLRVITDSFPQVLIPCDTPCDNVTLRVTLLPSFSGSTTSPFIFRLAGVLVMELPHDVLGSFSKEVLIRLPGPPFPSGVPLPLD